MSLATENTVLLSEGYAESPHQRQTNSYCIDVLEKPRYEYNGYAPILAEDDFSAGLTLEELLPFVDDPWWQKLRRTLFCTFWLIFLLILITACMLAYMQLDKNCSTTRTNAVTRIATTTTTAAGLLQKI